MTEKKSNRGGKREGAGRPSKENRTVTIAFCCYPEERDRLKEAVKESGKTQSASKNIVNFSAFFLILLLTQSNGHCNIES